MALPSPKPPRSLQSRVQLVVFLALHLSPLLILFTGVSWTDIAVMLGLYWIRMFAITAGYHRFFAHRAYQTSRVFQLLLAIVGTTAVQKGPLWWASTHRHHHRYSDKPNDAHSPRQQGFWYAHIGWIVSQDREATDESLIRDLLVYPELRWLDRYHWVPPVVLALAVWALAGPGALVWGMGVGTLLVLHATFAVNSLAHVWGSRRFDTSDDSRNNVLIALLTMGEGWHNNHHRYCSSANQGFFWWEVDASYYALRALSLVRIVRALKSPPPRLLAPPPAVLPAMAAIPPR